MGATRTIASVATWLIAAVLRLLVPTPAATWPTAILVIAAFALGASLGMVWLTSATPLWVPVLVVLLLVGLATLVVTTTSKWVRLLAMIPLVVAHLFWLYIVLSLGTLLAWSPPLFVQGFTLLLAVLAFVGAFMSQARFRLPSALPLGVWIAACLVGWVREDGVLRCDDYFAMQRSGAALLVATTGEVAGCRPGERLRTGHYPRRVWEAPEGGRLVMTTQLGLGRFWPSGREVADRFPGTVCDVPLGGTPSCFGQGKAQALVESPRRDRLFVAGWQQHRPDGNQGVLYVLPRTTPLTPLAEVYVPENVGELFYHFASDTVGLLSDEMRVLRPVRVHDRAVLDPIPAAIIPGETRYDEERDEGIFCFAPGPLRPLDGEAYVSIAFRGHPFSVRALGASHANPTSWISMVWACDWDPTARRVYVADASLGFLVTIDYDSGRILDRTRIDFGARYLTFDVDRNVFYIANFLRGDVVAIDAATGDELRRWFVGRFTRHVVLTRDRSGLLVTSNIGVVRIPLDTLRGRAVARASSKP